MENISKLLKLISHLKRRRLTIFKHANEKQKWAKNMAAAKSKLALFIFPSNGILKIIQIFTHRQHFGVTWTTFIQRLQLRKVPIKEIGQKCIK